MTITIAQTTGSIIEVISTIVTPWAIHYFSNKQQRSRGEINPTFELEAEEFLGDEDDRNVKRSEMNNESILETIGLIGISWQFLTLVSLILSF